VLHLQINFIESMVLHLQINCIESMVLCKLRFISFLLRTAWIFPSYFELPYLPEKPLCRKQDLLLGLCLSFHTLLVSYEKKSLHRGDQILKLSME
jgi:hypothetical protein